MMKIIEFRGYRCYLEVNRYTSNNRVALQLYSVLNGEAVAIPTVNLPEYPDEKLDQFAALHEVDVGRLVFIKDYGDNAGMLDAMTEQGVILNKVTVSATSRFVTVPLAILSEDIELPLKHELKRDMGGNDGEGS